MCHQVIASPWGKQRGEKRAVPELSSGGTWLMLDLVPKPIWVAYRVTFPLETKERL